MRGYAGFSPGKSAIALSFLSEEYFLEETSKRDRRVFQIL